MYDFEKLPTKGIIFIDNCVFGTNLELNFSMDQLIEDQKRFRNLQKELSTKNNWLIIPEIIKEGDRGEAYLYWLKEEIGESRIFGSLTKDKFSSKKARKVAQRNKKKLELCKATGDYIYERRIFSQRFLREDFRNATKHLTEKQFQRVEELIQDIEPIFLANKGIPNKLNTDCKLIATALVYAETTRPSKDEYVYMFSYDNPLLNTFAEATRTLALTLENTYIINKHHSIIPSWKYENKKSSQYS